MENWSMNLFLLKLILLIILYGFYILGAEGQACTMVIRTLHWTVPHYWIWGLPFYLFYSTRLSQFPHQRPNQGPLRTLLCHLLSPVVCIYTSLLNSLSLLAMSAHAIRMYKWFLKCIDFWFFDFFPLCF